jgi:hypothetical protein
MVRRVRLISALVSAIAVVLLSATSAGAATNLGSTFVPGGFCSIGTTYIQTVSSGPPYSAPSTGVITSWSFQPGAAVPTTIELKVGRTEPGADLTNNANITIVGQSTPETPTGAGLNTFPTRIPVQAGDDIGIYINGPGPAVNTCNSDSTYTDHYWSGDIAPGTTDIFTEENFHHDVSAILEPDADHDQFGDETQDQCPTNASTQGTCPAAPVTPVTTVKKKKCKKHKKHRSAESAKKKKCKKKKRR